MLRDLPGAIMKMLLLFCVVMQQVPAMPDTLVVEPPSAILNVGATQQFTARAIGADGHELEGLSSSWFIREAHVATISSSGLLTAHAPGTVRVAVVVGGRPAYATVEIVQLPVHELRPVMPSVTVYEGLRVPVKVVARTELGDVVHDLELDFRSANRRIARVDAQGLVSGRAPGQTVITARADGRQTDIPVEVVANPAVGYQIAQNRVNIRHGDVVRFRVFGVARDGAQVDGIYARWQVSPDGAAIVSDGSDGVFVAQKEGTYTVTATMGEDVHKSIVVAAEPRRYNARLEKVGRGPADTHHSGDMWVFEGTDGRDYAYVGTYLHDWMTVWDVTDPAAPVLTDSLQLDARRINDVKIHGSNRLAVVTREGASSRRNGIVILDLNNPAQPSILSEYTDTVTGGVHNVWIEGDLVYACHNGTNDLHIIDIADPAYPREVGRWGLEKRTKTLHDVIVQDGYAYLSYWNDGVVTLDVGAGTHGGTPVQPAWVSSFSYPEGHTHVAWRHGRYLFVGDEIWPPGFDADSPIEATGYVHVLDMTDIDHPQEVARYEVPGAGAHNLWADQDRLYVGYYQGGLRVLDISGELSGDLYLQGRELAHFLTTDNRTMVPGWPMAWGAQLFKGHIYTSDLNSGLWVLRLEEALVVP